jgi:hypothetical protein
MGACMKRVTKDLRRNSKRDADKKDYTKHGDSNISSDYEKEKILADIEKLTKGVDDFIKRGDIEVGLSELLQELKSNGGSDKNVGLYIEAPYFTMSDASDFSLILRNSFQDVFSVSGRDRKYFDPQINKISHSSPFIINFNVYITISNSTIISLGVVGALIKYRKELIDIFTNFKNSSLVKNVKKYFAKRKPKMRKGYHSRTYIEITDKGGNVIERHEIYERLNNK